MFYKFFRYICYLLLHLFWFIKIEEEEPLKNEGPYILAANHVSYLDPIVLGVAFKRQVIFIAKKEIFEVPIIGLIVKSLGAIPVDRKKTNPVSMKRSLSLLKNGYVLGIFPEGTRSLDGELLKFNMGMVKIALNTESPIVPIGIVGTFDIFPSKSRIPKFLERKKITIHFGKPMYLDYNRRKDIKYQEESLLKIKDEIKRLTNISIR